MPTPARSEPTEHNIQILIMDYLALRYPQFYLWRNNTGAIPDKRGIPVRFGKVGSADILGIAPDGKFVALEVKKPSTRTHTTPAQDAFLEAIASRGGYAGVVTSTEDVDRLLAPSRR